MDRATVYTGEQGRSTDFLFQQRAIMIAIGKLAQMAIGSTTLVRGLPVTPNSPAALNVLVGIGEIYSLIAVDATQWGILPADTADLIVKQGLNMAVQTLATPAPTTGGFSVNYLIEAIYQDQDNVPVVLPYYNSANVSQPLSGQNNSGAAQPTQRQGVCVLQAKAGAPATTGTQTTPAPDSGYTGLAVVTVAFGQTTVVAGNITPYAGVPQISNLLSMMQGGSTTYAVDSSTTVNQVTLVLTPPITAYADGEPIRFQAANANTGPVILNAGPGGIALNGGVGALQGGELVAGRFYEAVYKSNTGTAVLIGQSGGGVQVSPATQSQHAAQLGQVQGAAQVSGLIGKPNATTPLTQYDVTAASVTLRNPTTGATSVVTNTGVITINAALAGPIANGRDQAASFTAAQWLYKYFIYNPTTSSLATIFSTATPAVGPTLPGGYTAWAYIGTIYWNGSSNLAQVYARGSWYAYQTMGSAVAGGGAMTSTAVPIPSLVPPPAYAPMFELSVTNLQVTSTSGGQYSGTLQISADATINTLVCGLQGVGQATVAATAISGQTKRMPNINQSFNYVWTSLGSSTGPSASISVGGYSVSNGGEE